MVVPYRRTPASSEPGVGDLDAARVRVPGVAAGERQHASSPLSLSDSLTLPASMRSPLFVLVARKAAYVAPPAAGTSAAIAHGDREAVPALHRSLLRGRHMSTSISAPSSSTTAHRAQAGVARAEPGARVSELRQVRHHAADVAVARHRPVLGHVVRVAQGGHVERIALDAHLLKPVGELARVERVLEGDDVARPRVRGRDHLVDHHRPHAERGHHAAATRRSATGSRRRSGASRSRPVPRPKPSADPEREREARAREQPRAARARLGRRSRRLTRRSTPRPSSGPPSSWSSGRSGRTSGPRSPAPCARGRREPEAQRRAPRRRGAAPAGGSPRGCRCRGCGRRERGRPEALPEPRPSPWEAGGGEERGAGQIGHLDES